MLHSEPYTLKPLDASSPAYEKDQAPYVDWPNVEE